MPARSGGVSSYAYVPRTHCRDCESAEVPARGVDAVEEQLGTPFIGCRSEQCGSRDKRTLPAGSLHQDETAACCTPLEQGWLCDPYGVANRKNRALLVPAMVAVRAGPSSTTGSVAGDQAIGGVRFVVE